ncbi:hypothetical protein ASZ90_008715 [hydrocarbon metagenome]|uniref:Uncharacterized protein n=1 Tax=hydrocarbon metagenome TaxID=938273 RepID=A0A0W8FLM7_9ZZZZ
MGGLSKAFIVQPFQSVFFIPANLSPKGTATYPQYLGCFFLA